MSAVVGAILAGGRGSRLGGAKACVPVAGRPLIAWPLEALRAALEEVVVVCKRDSELPALTGVEVVREADRPQHPLTGIVAALSHARGRPVLVCAVDLPLITEELVRTLVDARSGGASAVIARGGGRPQPLLGRYEHAAARGLRAAAGGAPLTDTVLALGAAMVDVDERLLHNVNAPEDLAAAARMLAARTQ